MAYKDREKQREYQREWSKARSKGKRQSDERRDWINARKKPCAICGEDDPVCIDFHHLDPSTKDMNVNTALKTKPKDVVEREIAKCICLCRNCHAKFHAGRLKLSL